MVMLETLKCISFTAAFSFSYEKHMNSLLGKYGNHVENLIRYRPLSKEGAKIKMGTRVLTYNTYLQVYFPEEKRSTKAIYTISKAQWICSKLLLASEMAMKIKGFLPSRPRTVMEVTESVLFC
jgi:hypothetical protein